MIFALLTFIQLYTHPFHVSVTEVKYKEESKSLQISSRIFLDDLEVALRVTSGYEKLDITSEKDWAIVDANLKEYVLANLKLHGGKGPLEVSYLGAEIEKDVMWVYLEIEKVKKIKSIKVVNRLLTDIYNDQENIVHFRAYGKVKSARFYEGNVDELFEWEN